MQVKCLSLLQPEAGEEQQESNFLREGTTYTVLSLFWDCEADCFIRIMGEQPQEVALFPLSQFEIIESQVNPHWVIHWVDQVSLELTPRSWTEENFWERFYDREPASMLVFQEEVEKIFGFWQECSH